MASQSVFIIFAVILTSHSGYALSISNSDFNYSTSTTTTVLKETILETLQGFVDINKTTILSLLNFHRGLNENVATVGTAGTRVKRQQGSTKYEESAKMGPTKTLRTFLQLAKNSMVSSYVGAAHPLHPEAPKIFVELILSKVFSFFVPELSKDDGKDDD